jgi:hypothetical protein
MSPGLQKNMKIGPDALEIAENDFRSDVVGIAENEYGRAKYENGT